MYPSSYSFLTEELNLVWIFDMTFSSKRLDLSQYEKYGINLPLLSLIFGILSRGYRLITDLKGYVYSFCQIFQRLHLIKGLRLFWTQEYKITIETLIINLWYKKIYGNQKQASTFPVKDNLLKP